MSRKLYWSLPKNIDLKICHKTPYQKIQTKVKPRRFKLKKSNKYAPKFSLENPGQLAFEGNFPAKHAFTI